jgi:type IV secretory pathway TrbL component
MWTLALERRSANAEGDAMAVVINDMEVAPQPAGQAGAQQSRGGGDASGKDKLKQMEKTLHKKQQRKHRLEAY